MILSARAFRRSIFVLLVAGTAIIGCNQQRVVAAADARPSCQARTVERLSFGLSGPRGDLGDSSWTAFVEGEIAPRFPAGHTVYDTRGQWRGADGKVVHERSRMVEVVHDGAPRHRQEVREIVTAYKRAFAQEAVLVTRSTAVACLA